MNNKLTEDLLRSLTAHIDLLHEINDKLTMQLDVLRAKHTLLQESYDVLYYREGQNET